MLLPTYKSVYGLVWVYQNVVTEVPLQGVSVEVQVVDFCARTTISQQFYNNRSFPIEAVYVFPLDERAAVCAFESDIDGVVTKGEVRKKEEARATYEAAVARGDGAQLLEQKRTDIFELSVGNLLPGQTATISITMVADLKIEGEDVRYFLPTFVAPRYTPWTESDPIRSGNVRRVLNGLQLRARVDMTDTITAISSPSHAVSVESAAGSKTAIVDLAAGSMKLDKDFVLLVRTENPHQPRVCVEVAPDGSVATMIMIAPGRAEVRADLCCGSVWLDGRDEDRAGTEGHESVLAVAA
eukprot:m.713848 g.713848  ORF g.713848 m.713848 type:complete len:297 (-) comp58781_c0_seq54:1888-2778(-)